MLAARGARSRRRRTVRGTCFTWAVSSSLTDLGEAARAVLVIRHGQTTWNAQGLWQGWVDTQLSDLGKRQAVLAAETMAAQGLRWSSIISSDLLRARDTAAKIASALNKTVEIDAGWRERGIGRWSGLTTAEIEAGWPGALDAWRSGKLASPPEGEADTDFRERANAALLRAAEATAPGTSSVVVAHGGLASELARLIPRVDGVDEDNPRISNLGGFWFFFDDCGVRRSAACSMLEADERGASNSL